MLYETFSANLDWPQNNVKLWRLAPGERFRWLFYDGVGCFTLPEYNAMNHSLISGGNSKVFIHFRENEEFLRMFRERYYELRETCLGYGYMKSVLDEYGRLVEGEVPRQSQRFRFPTSVNRWQADMQQADGFLIQRDFYYRSELVEYFGSVDDVVVPDSGFLCYPNPTADRFVVKGENLQRVDVYDLLGQFIASMKADGNVLLIDFSGRPAGVYLVSVTDTEGCRCVKKVVKN